MNKISVFYEHICTAAIQKGCSIEQVLTQAKKWGIELMEISFDEHFWQML